MNVFDGDNEIHSNLLQYIEFEHVHIEVESNEGD